MPTLELSTKQLDEMIEKSIGKALAEKRQDTIAHSKEAQKEVKEKGHSDEAVNALMRKLSNSIDEAGSMKEYAQLKEAKIEKGIKAARFIRCLAAAKNDTDKAANYAEHVLKDKETAGYLRDVSYTNTDPRAKALGSETMAGGGALVPQVFADDIIELLLATAVVPKMGLMEVPLENGNMTFSKMTAGSTGYWVGENTNITSSDPTFGEVVLQEKTLGVIVPISNKLIRMSSPKADVIVRDEIVRNMRATADLAMIRGLGTAYTPMGMLYLVQAANKFAATTGATVATLAEITADLGKMVRLVEEDDVVIENGGFLMSPQSKWRLLTVQTTTGDYAFKDEMMAGSLFTYKWDSTNQIPSNLGGGTESEVYFADFSKVMWGIGESLNVETFDGGTYYDGSSLVSGISQNQSIIRGLLGMDFNVRYAGKELSVLTTVKWI